jgi:tetratricopeptide (TPR) repeat protein
MNRQQRGVAAKQPSAGSDGRGPLLAAGLAHHRAGRLAQAEVCYRQVLADAPSHAEALHLLGMVAYQAGRHDAAVDLIGQAIRQDAADPTYYNNRGLVLRDLGRLDDALAGFDRAIALRPSYLEAHVNRGITLLDLKRPESALASFDRAIALRPGFAPAHSRRGYALVQLRRFDAAMASLDRAIALSPADPEAHCNRAYALAELGQTETALASYDRALTLRPGFAQAHRERGNALVRLNRFVEAVAAFRAAIALQPDSAALHNKLGNALFMLNRATEAVAAFDSAIALRPDYAEAHSNRGVALKALRRLPEALAALDRALELRPDAADAAHNKAHALLLTGRLAEGWTLLERRWEVRQLADQRRDFAQPAWRGEALAGRVLLLHAEQGLGDTIQLCRYAPLAARHGTVVLEVQPALLPLLAGQRMPRVIARGDPLPAFDLHCPLLSLPLAFGTELSTIPAAAGYLAADPDRIAAWAPRLAACAAQAGGPRAGIVWAGNAKHQRDAERSLPLAALLPLLDCGVTLLSLQQEVREGDRALFAATPRIARLAAPFGDLADTAAVIAQLDLVIAVDTAVAHLAAALGKPTWILLPYVPDWRWLLDRDDSPWYASVRLFRQSGRGDWAGVIGRVGEALAALTTATA